MLKIISIEIATDPREPFAWIASPSTSTPTLWDFHKQVADLFEYNEVADLKRMEKYKEFLSGFCRL